MRKPGWYWVKLDGEWIAAYYGAIAWTWPMMDMDGFDELKLYEDEDVPFTEIGPRIPQPNEAPPIGTRYRDGSGEVVAVVAPVEPTDDMCHEALYQFVDRGRGMGFALRCAILAAPGTPSE